MATRAVDSVRKTSPIAWHRQQSFFKPFPVFRVDENDRTWIGNALPRSSIKGNDGDTVITPAFNMTNAKNIIHAVGPDFSYTPTAFKELFDAYYNSLCVLKENDLHSISFPLISSGIFGGDLPDPAGESTKQCCRAYNKFTSDYPDYEIEVKLCAFTQREMTSAQSVFSKLIK